MDTREQGRLPRIVEILARPPQLVQAFGALPLGAVLTRALRDLARRRPGLFDRLGEHRTRVFVIAPTDLDLVFRMVPDGRAATITVGVGAVPDGDVTVRGPILALVGLLDGTFDGDALFFDRTLAVSGRTDALVALRNAIEDAELKPSDLAGLPGAFGRAADRAVPRLIAALRGGTGPVGEAAR